MNDERWKTALGIPLNTTSDRPLPAGVLDRAMNTLKERDEQMSKTAQDALQQVSDEISDLESEIAGLRDEIATRDEEIESLNERLESAHEMIDDLTRELSEERDRAES